MKQSEMLKILEKIIKRDIEITLEDEFDMDVFVLSIYFKTKPNFDKWIKRLDKVDKNCEIAIELENISDRECDYNYRILFCN